MKWNEIKQNKIRQKKKKKKKKKYFCKIYNNYNQIKKKKKKKKKKQSFWTLSNNSHLFTRAMAVDKSTLGGQFSLSTKQNGVIKSKYQSFSSFSGNSKLTYILSRTCSISTELANSTKTLLRLKSIRRQQKESEASALSFMST